MNPSPAPLYAGFWRRAGAATLDGLIFSTPGLILSLAGFEIGQPWMEMAIWTIGGWLYYALLHSSAWQATFGKRAFGIKVTGLQGERIGFGRATWRYLASLVSTVIFCIGYLMAAWTQRKQALHDKMAGTLVVNAAVAAEDVPSGAGVMPISGATIAAIAFLLIASIAFTVVSYMFMDPYAAAERKAEALPRDLPASAGKEEKLSYAIYVLPFWSGAPEFVKEGTRVYRHSEIYALDRSNELRIKVLNVTDGYAIHANLFREARIGGFGLSLVRNGGGFSWEWFDHDSGDIFHKRQGGGRVQVRFVEYLDGQELAEVRFLDDITMRLDRWMIPFRTRKSDHLVVKRGSVLWLAD